MALDLSLDNRIFLDTELDCAIQELDMLFNTTNTELIGNTDYGSNFEQFLWQVTDATESLRDYVYERLKHTYFVSKFDTTVNIRTEAGTTREIYYVEISFNNLNTDDEAIEMKSHRVYMLT